MIGQVSGRFWKCVPRGHLEGFCTAGLLLAPVRPSERRRSSPGDRRARKLFRPLRPGPAGCSFGHPAVAEPCGSGPWKERNRRVCARLHAGSVACDRFLSSNRRISVSCPWCRSGNNGHPALLPQSPFVVGCEQSATCRLPPECLAEAGRGPHEGHCSSQHRRLPEEGKATPLPPVRDRRLCAHQA